MAKRRKKRTSPASAKTRRTAPRAPPSGGSGADGEDVVALRRELFEALEQQAATSEVLRVIASSPGNLQPVFETMLANAVRICEAKFGSLYLREGDALRAVALHGAPPLWAEERRRNPVIRPSPDTTLGRSVTTKQTVQIADIQDEPAYVGSPSGTTGAQLAKLARARTVVAVPMLKDTEVVGAIVIFRKEVRPFTAKQIELVTNFAHQAVIAIENTRLLNELRQRTTDLSEALEQQTATSEVLRVISSSPGELKPVFCAMLGNAVRICEAKFGTLYLCEGDGFRALAMHNAPPSYAKARAAIVHPPPDSSLGQAARTKEAAQVADATKLPAYIAGDPFVVSAVESAGYRTVLTVPMLKEDELVGAISIYRQEVRPFSEKQIALVSSFAAQAVIAIENTRLLNELRESLQQQMATGNVLEVISRSAFDLQPVLDTVIESSVRLCEADKAFFFRYDGELLRVAAALNASAELVEFLRQNPIRPEWRHSVTARAARDRCTFQTPDMQADPELSYGSRDVDPVRTVLGVPVLKGDDLLGVIIIYRLEVKLFTDKQVALVETFADQAAIAIENVRLFDQVQARTHELSESLEQQTATSEVLEVISSSPGELDPVFERILENATRICAAHFGVLWRLEGGSARIVSSCGIPQAFAEFLDRGPHRPGPFNPMTRLIKTRQNVHIADYRIDQAYIERDALAVAGVELGGVRTLLVVPMIKDEELVGAIGIFHQEVRPFSDKQIALVSNFAAQAVIAIENTRLLNELRESLQQQTATADVLKVISRSTFDLPTVLNALVESAAQLCEADKAQILRPTREDGSYYSAASYGHSPEYLEHMRAQIWAPGRGTTVGRVMLEGKSVQIPDVLADPEYTAHETQRLGGFRTILVVPLLREGLPIGLLAMHRAAVRPFTQKQKIGRAHVCTPVT